MRIAIFTLTDDPFEAPGVGGHGGSHVVMFDMGRHFVRAGAKVVFVTRRDRPGKNEREKVGEGCEIVRLKGGPTSEVPYYECGAYIDEIIDAAKSLPELCPDKIDRLVSYNWISGECVRRLYLDSGIPHIHCVLALARVRLANGESPNKVSELWQECELKVLTSADQIVTCSRNELAELTHLYPEVDPSRLRCIPLGVDTDVFGIRPLSSDHYLRRTTTRFA
ncbi:MAG: D-inositol-3-phosphate glycosyltransferase [Blastocatellia bacterium]|nr:D-inositol-3-phosphate glycosyltransferase [Blastocatellia bacterium]